MGDAGVVAQRYQLVLFGNHQRARAEPWQPETGAHGHRAVRLEAGHLVPLEAAGGEPARRQGARRMGKVWPVGEPEPAAWLVERIDPIAQPPGQPGIYADAPVEVFFDNVKVVSNR